MVWYLKKWHSNLFLHIGTNRRYPLLSLLNIHHLNQRKLHKYNCTLFHHKQWISILSSRKWKEKTHLHTPSHTMPKRTLCLSIFPPFHSPHRLYTPQKFWITRILDKMIRVQVSSNKFVYSTHEPDFDNFIQFQIEARCKSISDFIGLQV